MSETVICYVLFLTENLGQSFIPGPDVTVVQNHYKEIPANLFPTSLANANYRRSFGHLLFNDLQFPHKLS